MDIRNLIVGAECGAERPNIGWSGGAVSGRCRKTAERGAGGLGAGTERRAGVTEIGWSVERLFHPLRSAHMLWS